MPGELVPIIIVPAFFFMIGYIVQVVSTNRAKRTLITQQVAPEMVGKLFLEPSMPDSNASLKWGLIAVSIGVAFCLLQLLPFDADEPIAYGIVFLFGGAALLAHYVLSQDKA